MESALLNLLQPSTSSREMSFDAGKSGASNAARSNVGRESFGSHLDGKKQSYQKDSSYSKETATSNTAPANKRQNNQSSANANNADIRGGSESASRQNNATTGGAEEAQQYASVTGNQLLNFAQELAEEFSEFILPQETVEGLENLAQTANALNTQESFAAGNFFLGDGIQDPTLQSLVQNFDKTLGVTDDISQSAKQAAAQTAQTLSTLANPSEAQEVPDLKTIVTDKQIAHAAGGQKEIVKAVAGDIINIAQGLAATPEFSDDVLTTSRIDQVLHRQPNKEGQQHAPTAALAQDKPVDPLLQQLQQRFTNTQQQLDKQATASSAPAANIASLDETVAVNASAASQPTAVKGDATLPEQSLADTLEAKSAALSQAEAKPLPANAATNSLPPVEAPINFDKMNLSLNQIHKNLNTQNLTDPKNMVAQVKFGVDQAVQSGNKQVSIQLYPKELGTVDMHMETTKDGKTHVKIIAERTDTMNLMQKESDGLRGILQDSLKADSSQLSFSFHDRSEQNWKQLASQFGGDGSNQSDEEELAEDIAQPQSTYIISNDSVDIRV